MKVILTGIMILACWGSYSQSKIEGLGKFKINKTKIAYMDSLAEESGDKINLMDEYINMDSDLFRVGEILATKPNPDDWPEGAVSCPGVRVFYLPIYEVAGITIEGVHLTFKDGLLVGIKCDDSKELIDGIVTKYGTALIKEVKTKVTCQGQTTGNKVFFEGATYTRRWLNGPIVATSLVKKYFDNNCKPQYLMQLTVNNEQLMASIVACNDQSKANAKQAIGAKKRKALKDL